MDVVDFSFYPDREYQLSWLRSFLEFSFVESGRLASDVTDVDVERLYVQVNKFSLVSFSLCLCEGVHVFSSVSVGLPSCHSKRLWITKG